MMSDSLLRLLLHVHYDESSSHDKFPLFCFFFFVPFFYASSPTSERENGIQKHGNHSLLEPILLFLGLNMTEKKSMTFPTQTKQTEKTKSNRTEAEKKMVCVVKLLSKISKVPRDGPGIGLLTSLPPRLPLTLPFALSLYLSSADRENIHFIRGNSCIAA